MSRSPVRRLALAIAGGPLVASMLLVAPVPVSASTSQAISFTLPLSGSIGATVQLAATASSGLAVDFTTTTPDTCSVDGVDLALLATGTCSVTASQPGDASWDAAPDVTRTLDVAPGYDATVIVLHDGVARTDGAIQVGDELSVAIGTPEASVGMCHFRLTTAGGWLMEFRGLVGDDGLCTFSMVLPAPADPAERLGWRSGRTWSDLCISIPLLNFLDSVGRVMDNADRRAPGGFGCYNGTSYNDDAVIDLRFDGTGTPKPFTSTPPVLSWNPYDWDPSYEPLEFNKTWHVAFPDWVESCDGPYLNGEWTTVYVLGRPASGCPDWDLRLAGVLPKQMPWGGGPGSWGVELILRYVHDTSYWGQTILTQDVAYKPSDSVFQSTFPAVAPDDLAATRFVNISDDWNPQFRYSSFEGAVSCRLELFTVSGPGQVSSTNYEGTVDPADKRCDFEVPAFAQVNEHHQYYVYVESDMGERAVFGGSITAIADAKPPKVNPPQDGDGDNGNGGNGHGRTTLTASAGLGQAMSLELSAEAAPGNPARVTAATVIEACADTVITTSLSTGGTLADASATCDLPAGDYVVTARMVDASGKVLVDTATITIAPATPDPSASPDPSPSADPSPSPSAAPDPSPDPSPSADPSPSPSASPDPSPSADPSPSPSAAPDPSPDPSAPPVAPAISGHAPTGTVDRFTLPSVTFDTPVTSGTLLVERQGSSGWAAVAGTTAVSGSKLVFHPSVTFVPGAYRATLTAAADGDLAVDPGLTWTWTARYAAPLVTGASPASGRIGSDRDASVRITFKDLVRNVGGTTVKIVNARTGARIAVRYTVTRNVVVLDPYLRLAAGTRYTVIVTTGVTSPTGQHGTAKTWSFTTGRT